jgi:hypothetical protein
MPLMRRLLVIAFASALVTASSAEAETPRSNRTETAGAPSDKVICRRFARTGSLADSYKTCKTKHEWDRERENVRQLSVSDSCRDRAKGGNGCAG